MKDVKELGKLFREDPKLTAVTLAAMAVGAIMGVTAFYNGWLG